MTRSERKTLQLLSSLLEACQELEKLLDGVETRSQALQYQEAA